jgi:hypothetical protein
VGRHTNFNDVVCVEAVHVDGLLVLDDGVCIAMSCVAAMGTTQEHIPFLE